MAWDEPVGTSFLGTWGAISRAELWGTSTGPCESALALVLPVPIGTIGTGAALLVGLASPLAFESFGGTYSSCTVLRLASRCCLLLLGASSSAVLGGCFCAVILPAEAGDLPDSLTDALLPSTGSSLCRIADDAISLSLFVLLPMKPTTWLYSLSQLCRATSNRSALLLGSGTSIRRSRSRACGVTYSGKVRGVETMYLYSRLILSPSGFAGSSSKGK